MASETAKKFRRQTLKLPRFWDVLNVIRNLEMAGERATAGKVSKILGMEKNHVYTVLVEFESLGMIDRSRNGLYVHYFITEEGKVMDDALHTVRRLLREG